jgi:hypothetical protein
VCMCVYVRVCVRVCVLLHVEVSTRPPLHGGRREREESIFLTVTVNRLMEKTDGQDRAPVHTRHKRRIF